MKNRAKCKLCNEIIESFHRHDYVSCKCGEISIDGGLDYLRTSAKNYDNFLRVDDEGNEIKVTIKDKEEPKEDIPIEYKKPKKAELLSDLKNMRIGIENLPNQGIYAPVTNYEFGSLLLLLEAIFAADGESFCNPDI